MTRYTVCYKTAVNENGKKLLEEGEDERYIAKRIKSCEPSPWDIEFEIEESGVLYKVRAHRQVVAPASPVFEAVCCRNVTGTSKAVRASDVSFDAFLVLLNAIYCKEYCIDSVGIACRTLLAAKNYAMPQVAMECMDYIRRRFVAMFACEITEFALDQELDELLSECRGRICPIASEVLGHPSFLCCSLRTVLFILDSDHLAVSSEAVVSDACVLWAETRCRENGLAPSRDNLRVALGPALGKIRFLSMSTAQLIHSSAFDRLLTDEEDVVEEWHNYTTRSHSSSDGSLVTVTARHQVQFMCMAPTVRGTS